MRVLAAIPLALLPLASAASAPNPPAPANCDPIGQIRTADAPDAPGTLEARRLGDLPPGHLDLAVMREVNGCPEPVTIRENFGAVAPRSDAARRPARPALPRTRLLGR